MVKKSCAGFRQSNAKQRVEQFLNTPANRDLVDVLRVRYWYEGVKRQMNCSTAYQLERLFEPLAAISVDERTPFRNKWIRYETGKHTPRANLVDLVEGRVPGSSKELSHPLWEVLRLGDASVPRLDAWLEKLEPRVQTALYRKPYDGMTAPNWRLAFSMSMGRRLVKLGNLDALAALLLLWLEARHHDRLKDMQQLAGLLYQLLLMLGMEFVQRDMAEELFLMFRAKVFDRTDWEGGRFALDETLYVRGTHLLYCLLYKVRDMHPFSSWFARCQAMQALLNGKKGLDAQFGLQILLVPDWRDGPPTRKQWWLWRQHNLHWLWGWVHLNRDTSGRTPDDALWDELEAKFDTFDWAKSRLPAWAAR